MISLLQVIAVCTVGLAAASAQSHGESRPEIRELLAGLQANYEQIRSFSADFVQHFRGRNVDLRESGILIMKKPGKMYWEYRDPTHKIFVANGRKAYFYIPEDRQVLESDFSLDEEDTPLLFLFGRGNIDEDFWVGYEPGEEPLGAENFLLRLEPRQPQAEFLYLLLEVDPERYLIHRLSVIEPVGQRNDYVLSNLRPNVRVDDKQFRFKIPKGVDVIRQD